MKKIVSVFSLVLLIALLGTSTALADLPGTGWWSALFVQNVGPADGSVEMKAYPSGAGSEIGSNLFDFSPGEALVYDPGKTPNYPGGPYIGFTGGLPSGFEGSVVLSSSVPVAAISEIANYPNGPVGGGGTAKARYQGMSSDAVSTTLMVPTIKNNYAAHTTTLYVQAAGADANVTVTFNMNDGNSYSQTKLITANKMFVFDPSNAGVPSTGCGFDANTSPCFGSAEIVSTTGPVAANVVEHPHSGAPAGYALSTRAQSPADFDTKLFHPAVKNDYYNIMVAGASIMNVGSNPAMVKITMTVTAKDSQSTANVGDVYTDQAVIQPGSSLLFSKWLNNIGGMPKGTFAAAVVESIASGTYTPQNLVGATNDSKFMPAITPGSLGITLYAGFPNSKTTSKIAAPIVTELLGSITGGLTVQNVGTAPDKIVFEYYPLGSSTPYVFETTNTVAVGAAVNTNQVSKETTQSKFTRISPASFTSFSQLKGKQFSVIAYSKAGQSIIGLASEYSPLDNIDIANFEAITLAP